MPSAKYLALQDEAANIANEIETLRAMPAADDAEKAKIEERLAERSARAEVVGKEAAAERDLDDKVAAMRQINATSDSDSRKDVEKAEKRRGPAIHVLPGKSLRGFGTVEAAEKAGRFLRALARGDMAEARAMGETSPTYDNAGAELVSPELFRGYIDVLGYQSVGLQVAQVYTTSSHTLEIPTIGEIAAEWFDEYEAVTDDDAATDKVTIPLYKMGRIISFSNELIQDSSAVVNLAQLAANRFGLAIAKKVDEVWLQGDNAKGIDGLVDEISAGNEVEAGTDYDGADLASVVGKIDSRAMNTAWVVSSAGWEHLMKSSVVSQSTTIGERVLPVVMGAPVYKCLGLPAGTLALYGDFTMATAVAVKSNGLVISASEHAGFSTDAVKYRGLQRLGLVNHDASFVAKLVEAGS
jgi:HK97 family phage major capsid protein